jgi:hypothetical protein
VEATTAHRFVFVQTFARRLNRTPGNAAQVHVSWAPLKSAFARFILEEDVLEALGLSNDRMNQSLGHANLTPLSQDDIVPDEPLQGIGKANISAEQDLLHHRVIARRIAELALSASGKVNVALFGPWGSGKSSFNALLREELLSLDKSVGHVTFDAWKNTGDGFRANFLSELAKQISPKNDHVPDQLFQGTTKVSIPFGAAYVSTSFRRVLTIVGTIVFLIALFLGGPFLWSLVANSVAPVENFGQLWWENIRGWSAFGVGSTLILVVLAGLLELSKVTVSRSMPSHVTQFSKLFDHLLAAGKKKRYVVFVDELDRCTPEDVVKTLEGLRTFLGDDRCVFVVAFDREAVADAIANHLRHSVPYDPAAPYYGTSGEYLDKIFQFQLSLPPQPAHTFRRYALSLVSPKGGIWADLRTYRPHLLERVVTILAPMHLASPRRTKVLLNDFSVSARIYESLGFDWLQSAEEIAILAVLRTEFPALMADIEHNPALMRFLYRDEIPDRDELVTVLSKYSEASRDDGDDKTVPLDAVVTTADANAITDQLLLNLHRYLRRLREMRAPEPRAELIMMHSGGALVHFDDPAVYDAVLLSPDSPRTDVLEDLSDASERDRIQAIQHILEQAERESAQIAEHLRILAGELSAELPVVPVTLSDALRAAITAGLDGYSELSLRGYARALSAAFSMSAAEDLFDAAERSGGSVGDLIAQFVETLTEDDWLQAHPVLLDKALNLVLQEPEALKDVLHRLGGRPEATLQEAQRIRLARQLPVTKPAEVQPSSPTAAAKQLADEANAEANEAYETELDRAKNSTGAILALPHLLTGAPVLRGELFRVLREVEDVSGWHLDQHDRVVAEIRDSGNPRTANEILLEAIAQQPHVAAARWRKMLAESEPVNAALKAAALHSVIHRGTTHENIGVRENAAANALRIAQVPSEPVSMDLLANMVRNDINVEWEEYSDTRFEYQWTLLAALDAVNSDGLDIIEIRARLVANAIESAQAESASHSDILRRTATVPSQEAIAIATTLRESRLWEETDGVASQEILLTLQLRALESASQVQPLPASALLAISDATQRRILGNLWLQTSPPADEVTALLPTVDFAVAGWKAYAHRSTEADRAQLWSQLYYAGSSVAALKALGSGGLPVDIYNMVANSVRDASNTKARSNAIDQFLALPAASEAASIARGLVRLMSEEAKLTQVPLGINLIRAYASFWSTGVRTSLRGTLTPWIEAGEAYTTKTNVSWLTQQGFIAKKSSLFERFFEWAR